MLQRVIQSGWLPLILCGVYCLVMAPLASGFATLENAGNVLVAMLPLLIVASGQTVVLIAAGIDLSVTSVIALTSVLGASLLTSDGGLLASNHLGTAIAVSAMLLLGSFIGLANGFCVAWLRMPPFIVTLTTMMFLSGFAVWWTQSESIYNLPPSFLFLGKSLWAASAIACVVVLGIHALLTRTLIGLHLRAVGHNAQTARVSGVNVRSVVMFAYIACGTSAAMASVLITAQLETGSPVQWQNNLLDVIGATVIGGTSLFGGRGNVFWTASGVLLLALIDNSLNLLNLSHFTIMMTKGAVILLAAMLDTLRHQVAAQGAP
ncbi:MAG: ABC transporter permease [Pirellula sp.]